MRRDVLAGDIADKLLISEWICIEYQAGFSALPRGAKPFGAQKQAKLEGHIKPGQPVFVQFNPRNIVDAPSASFDQSTDFVDPGLARVVKFKRGAWDKAANEDNKYNRVEQGPISLVERAIDEYTTLVIGISFSLRPTSVRRHFPPCAGR